jgi:hypothetical protein
MKSAGEILAKSPKLSKLRKAAEPLTRAQEKLLDIATAIRLDPGKFEVAFMARELVQCTLPHTNPGNVPVWKRQNGSFTLGIVPGVNIETGKSYGYEQQDFFGRITADPNLILGSLGEFETCPRWVPAMDGRWRTKLDTPKTLGVDKFDHSARWPAKVRNASRLGRLQISSIRAAQPRPKVGQASISSPERGGSPPERDRKASASLTLPRPRRAAK